MVKQPELLDYEREAFRNFVDALPRSTLPWRQPSFNQPTFWSEPLVLSYIRPIGGSSGWVDAIDLRGNLAYTARVSGYVATTFGDAALSGVEFRFLYNNALVSTVSLAQDIEYSKLGPSSYPTIPRETFFVVRFNQRLQLQVRNNNAAPRYVIAALYGWSFDDSNPGEINRREGLTDA